MRISGYISPSKAADILGVDIKTVRNWCRKAIAGEPSVLKNVQQHLTGYYWISRAEIMNLKSKGVKK